MLLPAEGPTSSEEDVVTGVDLVRLPRPAVRDSVAEPFGPYKSPLLAFKTYRFSTYFRTKEQLLLSSPSFSNKVEPRWSFCHFELTGTCNDEDCPWQHMADCTLGREELFQDILSYDLPLLGCTSESSQKEIITAAESYVRGVLGPNTERVTADQVAVLLVGKVNERARHQPPFTTFKERRAWRPVAVRKTNAAGTAGGSDSESGDDGVDRGALPGPGKPGPAVARQVEAAASAACSERYFSAGSDDAARLEEAVERSPGDIQLWIKLSEKYLHQPECDPTEALNAALTACRGRWRRTAAAARCGVATWRCSPAASAATRSCRRCASGRGLRAPTTACGGSTSRWSERTRARTTSAPVCSSSSSPRRRRRPTGACTRTACSRPCSTACSSTSARGACSWRSKSSGKR
ncbi:zinc finger C3H1 domain-containing protein-like [Lethenteron reissneri]|uniref:zinc finger C3H1 domain-containing protein-like n=1 Tax=Lethenteron reissneri TaxID=7753 RepID=UPI002AB70960|nr:zinc finger C3H1 domain-containing protein-like [Lethenteron reissneri]